jgi:hypothetical protein
MTASRSTGSIHLVRLVLRDRALAAHGSDHSMSPVLRRVLKEGTLRGLASGDQHRSVPSAPNWIPGGFQAQKKSQAASIGARCTPSIRAPCDPPEETPCTRPRSGPESACQTAQPAHQEGLSAPFHRKVAKWSCWAPRSLERSDPLPARRLEFGRAFCNPSYQACSPWELLLLAVLVASFVAMCCVATTAVVLTVYDSPRIRGSLYRSKQNPEAVVRGDLTLR